MSALRESTSSNFADVKDLGVSDNTGASKTVSFASIVSEIDFELNNVTVQDATTALVTSRSPMQNEDKPAIDIDET